MFRVGGETFVLFDVEGKAVGGGRHGLRRGVGEDVGIGWEKRCFGLAMAGDCGKAEAGGSGYKSDLEISWDCLRKPVGEASPDVVIGLDRRGACACCGDWTCEFEFRLLRDAAAAAHEPIDLGTQR